jgi:ankyrin repeat protein
MDKIGNQLIKEVIENHIFEVEKILGKHPNVVNHQNINMWSALIFAAQYGYTECVRLLLWAGADTNIQTWNGWTALMYASRYGKIECVRLLLTYGANPLLKNDNKKTAYDITTNETIKKLLKNAMKTYPVMSLLGPTFKKKTGLPKDIGIEVIKKYLFSKKSNKKSKKSKTKKNLVYLKWIN